MRFREIHENEGMWTRGYKGYKGKGMRDGDEDLGMRGWGLGDWDEWIGMRGVRRGFGDESLVVKGRG